MNYTKKTMEILLVNYNNINNDLRKPCAEKEKFVKLIADLEKKIKAAPHEPDYPDSMTVLEFAIHLAKKANGINFS